MSDMKELWGETFWHETLGGEAGEELVPLAIQTTRAERELAGFDERGYQTMRDECARVNPGCGEPLLVLAATGEVVNGSESDGTLGTVDIRKVWEVGVDIGDRVRGLPHLEYQRHCAERDRALLSSSGVALPLSRDMTLAQAARSLYLVAESELARDLHLGEPQRAAALRQIRRERDDLVDCSGYSSVTLGELLDDARAFEERGRWSVLEITPDLVADILWHDDRYRGRNITEDDLGVIADNACDNLYGNRALAEVARDQVLAEAEVRLEGRALDEETFIEGCNLPLSETERSRQTAGPPREGHAVTRVYERGRQS